MSKDNIVLGFNKLLGIDSKLVKLSQPKVSNKIIFINVIKLYEDVIKRSNDMLNQFQIDTFGFETNYHQIIENLIYLKYGEKIYNTIMFYIHNRIIDGIITPFIDKNGNEFIFKNVKDLYDYLESNYSEIMK